MRPVYALVTVLAVFLAVGPVFAEDPDATVKVQSGLATAGAGWSWGAGAIQFQGWETHFTVDGLTAQSVNFDPSDTAGEVYNLKSVEQFAGTYKLIGTGPGGGSSVRLKNPNGVELLLKTRSDGIMFQTGGDGMTIKLE